MHRVQGVIVGLMVAGSVAFGTIGAPFASAAGPCADPSGNCPNGGLVDTQNPSAGNVDTQNPSAGNVVVQNPSAGNVDTQNPSANNATTQNPSPSTVATQNPSASNANVQNPSAGSATTQNPTGGNVTTQNPSSGNAPVTNPTGGNVVIPVAPAPAAQPCTFVLGFATLARALGAQAGGCTDSEGHNPANGDALQHTKGGLLVWRKADNWTAFTNGYQTWINGPSGIVQRLNTQRFSWEADAASYPIVSPPPVSPAPQPAHVAPTGQPVSPSNSSYCWSCKIIDAGSHRM